MRQDIVNAIARLRILITIACLLGGFLAGENIFRYTMEVPAWRHINISEWGVYSSHADLRAGIFLFPVEAIVSTLLLVVTSITVMRNKTAFQSVTLPVYAATIFALAGLGLTFLAAPYMLSVRAIGNDPAKLQEAFNHFHSWGFFRAIAQVLSFCLCVWTMGKMFSIK